MFSNFPCQNNFESWSCDHAKLSSRFVLEKAWCGKLKSIPPNDIKNKFIVCTRSGKRTLDLKFIKNSYGFVGSPVEAPTNAMYFDEIGDKKNRKTRI
jgi:hypothetical protein